MQVSRARSKPLCRAGDAAYAGPLGTEIDIQLNNQRPRRFNAGREEGSAMKTSIKVFGLGYRPWPIAVAAPAAAAEMKMMTGPQGGSWIPLGGQLKDMWEKAIPGLAVQVMPGAGIANVRAIEEGKAQVGFANSISTVDAMAGKPPFGKPHNNVCNVATLYPQYFQFVVLADAGINKFEDLKGKSHHNAAEGQHR